EKIESKETASYYAQRKIDVETVFGNIKQNMKFKRFHVRGAEKIFKEMGLVFLAHNFRKLVTRVRKYETKYRGKILYISSFEPKNRRHP
ncbi:transposase, partial [Staphylococcus pseudintermedius]|uniref:transposase n=1 Tax=Staphylococcus pseudintermedius TaxID=283734 RepID=UPI0007B21BDB